MDTTATLTNIDDYLKAIEESNYSRTYIVFVNKFINSYNTLNNYNKILLDTLINNKEILIKNTQVVLPDS
jgi:replicative DNA helicase